MPLTKNEDCGTNVDGSINYDYCKYCYAEGKFLQECTMDELKRTLEAMEIDYYKPAVKCVRNWILSGKLE